MKNIKIIKVNIFTYIVILFFIFSGYKKDLLYLFIVFTLHELGHIFFCYLFNVPINKFEIFPFGGILTLDKKINIEIYKDLLISFGGILFQLIFIIVNSFIFRISALNYYNHYLLTINLLPVFPFDGNKILFIIVSNYFSFYKSLIINYIFNGLFLIFLFMFKVDVSYSLIIIFIYFYVREIKMFNYYLNKFFLERYVYNLKFKRVKKYKRDDIFLLRRMTYGIFDGKIIKSEKELLMKKFDKCSYFW